MLFPIEIVTLSSRGCVTLRRHSNFRPIAGLESGNAGTTHCSPDRGYPAARRTSSLANTDTGYAGPGTAAILPAAVMRSWGETEATPASKCISCGISQNIRRRERVGDGPPPSALLLGASGREAHSGDAVTWNHDSISPCMWFDRHMMPRKATLGKLPTASALGNTTSSLCWRVILADACRGLSARLFTGT